MTSGSSDAGPAFEQTDIPEPVNINSEDSLSNPAVLSDEREPGEATEPAIRDCRHGLSQACSTFPITWAAILSIFRNACIYQIIC